MKAKNPIRSHEKLILKLMLLIVYCLAFLPFVSTTFTTWSHITHHHHIKSTEHIIVQFCHLFNTQQQSNDALLSRIEIKCGHSYFNNVDDDKLIFIHPTTNKKAVNIQLHLSHDHWNSVWESNHIAHPAECDVIVGGKLVISSSLPLSSSVTSRIPPLHQCWPMKDNKPSSPLQTIPIFAIERHMSSEQMTQLLDYLHYTADALVTHARLSENSTTNNDNDDDNNNDDSTRRRTLLQQTNNENDDVSGDALLEVLNNINMASSVGVGIRMTTIFENIVNPVVNAVSAQFPEIMYGLTKFPISIQMRDSIFESMKDMMTAPTLGNLDPNGPGVPSFLETQEKETFKNPGPAESPGEGIGNTLGMQVADSVTVELSDALWKSLKGKLEDSISNSVTRQTVRSLNHILTQALSHTISRMVVELASKSLTRSVAKSTNSVLIATLTQSVAATVTHALTRNPKSDYYCHYCQLHQLYCDLCRAQTKDSWEMDWKISYFSKYYAEYYSYYYSNYYVDVATDEFLKAGKREV